MIIDRYNRPIRSVYSAYALFPSTLIRSKHDVTMNDDVIHFTAAATRREYSQ